MHCLRVRVAAYRCRRKYCAVSTDPLLLRELPPVSAATVMMTMTLLIRCIKGLSAADLDYYLVQMHRAFTFYFLADSLVVLIFIHGDPRI